MNSKIDSWTFTVPLALSAHSRAEQLRRYQSNPQKAKEVYLNALAVYAVNFYLQCHEFETDWDKSDSCNPAMQMLMNVADLVVKNRGKLECRPVLPNAEYVTIPAEVWQERIGYVAVQLSESLREATLLGFVNHVACEELPLSKLRSLEELPAQLHTIKSAVNLSKWFENIFADGWQLLDTLLGTEATELAFSFRSALVVRRCKVIELGSSQSVVLIVAISQQSEQEVDISVEAQPAQGQIYLPSNLQLMLVDEDGEVIIDTHAKSDNKSIQLEFTGETQDCFSIKIAVGNVSVTENFVI
ncbi:MULTISPECIES: DUF1822 family protein [Fischerella]|uniref:DUF1822 domain-containing protein n=1 Tax=Fischerella muscicola CCMEE 5323 TaxID=2019572 RepID=A0A2N6K7N8_FISMU|nr:MULTISPECIES: DUF1822 family protein [Fischerella]MBD2430030.1 DUF1822 family protein [Fischerella sp. FACHB-380]PLZ93267.1 DUF1822 domain-containing protein [Fischerella muscicola CCMEE 5323]